jgi:F-type H+-transporting ATPase subunit alpha
MIEGLFDTVPLDKMPQAQSALQEASTQLPSQLLDRMFSGATFSATDRQSILDIARSILAKYV